MEATRTFYLTRGLPAALIQAAQATALVPAGKCFFRDENGHRIDLVAHTCTCDDFSAADCPIVIYHNGRRLRYCRHLLAAAMMHRMANRPAPPRRIKAGPAYPTENYRPELGDEHREYHLNYGTRYR